MQIPLVRTLTQYVRENGAVPFLDGQMYWPLHPVQPVHSQLIQIPAVLYRDRPGPTDAQSANQRIGVCTITTASTGFKVVRKGRSVVRVFDVDVNSCAFRAGLREQYILTHVNGCCARSLTKSEIMAQLCDRPLRICWENDGHCAEAATKLAESLPMVRQENERAMDQFHEQQLLRRVRRRLVGDNTREDMVQYLIRAHKRGQVLHHEHMFLEYGFSCNHCGFRLLQVETLLHGKNGKWCCKNGAWLEETYMSQLKPIPPQILEQMLKFPDVFSHQSLRVNQVLNLAALGIHPSRAEHGSGLLRFGNERIQCLSLHGQLYRRVLSGNADTSPAK